jgi:AcrR family transcriptional regulator
MTDTASLAPAREADGRRLRWTEHRAQRREAFVVAGVAAIDQHGQGASAEQIAESAGVSRTVLYRYFRDRDDLRQAIADHLVAEVVSSVVPHLAITPESTPREVITSTIGVIVEWLDEHPNLYLFLRDRRNGHSLETVESTLADQVAALLKVLMMFFGINDEQAEPGAYGIVGFVESAGAWWLARRTIARDAFAAGICNAVWHILEGTARANGVIIEYDEPLPFAALTEAGA